MDHQRGRIITHTPTGLEMVKQEHCNDNGGKLQEGACSSSCNYLKNDMNELRLVHKWWIISETSWPEFSKLLESKKSFVKVQVRPDENHSGTQIFRFFPKYIAWGRFTQNNWKWRLFKTIKESSQPSQPIQVVGRNFFNKNHFFFIFL